MLVGELFGITHRSQNGILFPIKFVARGCYSVARTFPGDTGKKKRRGWKPQWVLSCHHFCHARANWRVVSPQSENANLNSNKNSVTSHPMLLLISSETPFKYVVGLQTSFM